MKKQRFFLLYFPLILLIPAQLGYSITSDSMFGDDSILSMTPADRTVFINLKRRHYALGGSRNE